MSTATIIRPAEKLKPIPRREVQRRLRQLGISQNALARGIGRDQGLLGRVLRREIASQPIWTQVYAFFAIHRVPYPPDGQERSDAG